VFERAESTLVPTPLMATTTNLVGFAVSVICRLLAVAGCTADSVVLTTVAVAVPLLILSALTW